MPYGVTQIGGGGFAGMDHTAQEIQARVEAKRQAEGQSDQAEAASSRETGETGSDDRHRTY